jgi:2-(1,2-epoxy-1,2-dihydrophenyl)acetyl-CoA isomerase
VSYDNLLFAVEGGVATVTLNRPAALNALNAALKADLADVVGRLRDEPDIRAVILTGAGRGFCAGGDIREMRPEGGPLATKRKLDDILAKVLVPLATLKKPTIAAVNGFAVGAGFNLALACDMIVAADTAVFSQIFVKVGLVPDSGGLYFLPRVIGLNRAKELCFTGRDVSAAEGASLGFVNRVVPAAEVLSAAQALAGEIARGPGVAIALTKTALNLSSTASLAEMMELEALAQSLAASTPEHAEGIAAFAQRRKPDFVTPRTIG